MVVFGQKGCISAKMTVLEKNRLYSAKWFYSGKVVVFGKSGCIRAKLFVLVKSGCIRAEMAVFG